MQGDRGGRGQCKKYENDFTSPGTAVMKILNPQYSQIPSASTRYFYEKKGPIRLLLKPHERSEKKVWGKKPFIYYSIRCDVAIIRADLEFFWIKVNNCCRTFT